MYVKAVLGIAVLVGIFWVSEAIYSAGKKTQHDADTIVMDQFKAGIQKTTDDAIAKATKDKEDAIAANEVIKDDYEAQLLASRTLSGQLSSGCASQKVVDQPVAVPCPKIQISQELLQPAQHQAWDNLTTLLAPR